MNPPSLPLRQTIKRLLARRCPRLLASLLRLKPHWNRELYTFLQTIRKGDVVCDVGANLGNYTEVFGDIVGPAGQVCGFEPNPVIFRRLEQRLASPPHSAHVQVYNAAVSNTPGTITLHMPDDNDGQACIRVHAIDEWATAQVIKTFPCQAVTLDNFFSEKGLSRFDFLKIDVEGAEMLVLEGAQSVIQKYHPVVFLEVDLDMLGGFGFSRENLAAFFEKNGYDRFAVVHPSYLMPLANLRDAWPPRFTTEMTNVLAARSDMHAERIAHWRGQ